MGRSILGSKNISRPVNFEGSEPLIKLWINRMMILAQGYRKFIIDNDYADDDIAEFLGVSISEDEKSEISHKELLKKLHDAHQAAEENNGNSVIPESYLPGISQLASLVELSEAERVMVGFSVALHTNSLMQDACRYLGQMNTLRIIKVLSLLLGLQEKQVREVVSKESVLIKSGIIEIKVNYHHADLDDSINVISESFADQIVSGTEDPLLLFESSLKGLKLPSLTIDDYSFLGEKLQILREYLKVSLKGRKRGVNLFIYGLPGTGKTELAGVLGRLLKAPVFEVVKEDEGGEPIKGSQRIRSLRAANAVLSSKQALLVFDESEDVFNDGGFFGQSTAQMHKGWVNEMLEENAVPTIWLSNSNSLDPAFIRRFDLVLELKVPPRSQREKIISKVCSGLISKEMIEHASISDQLAPAVISRAAEVLRRSATNLETISNDTAFELIVNETLKSQRHKPLPNRRLKSDAEHIYDIGFINSNCDMNSLLQGLKESQTAKLCLYGPPGTGKTAYGRWLANQLDKPLIEKKASDLISMWLGGTEKNIASAFYEAEQEGGMLMIDEVDSFLQDRRGAQKTWEVTAVNEMLTQMESFEGLFLASTNLVDGLDQASLRRFDLKIKLDYMEEDQAIELLARYCRLWEISIPEALMNQIRYRLNFLTPGDFSMLARQHRFKPFTSAEEIVLSLQEEVKLKDKGSSPIGFVV